MSKAITRGAGIIGIEAQFVGPKFKAHTQNLCYEQRRIFLGSPTFWGPIPQFLSHTPLGLCSSNPCHGASARVRTNRSRRVSMVEGSAEPGSHFTRSASMLVTSTRKNRMPKQKRRQLRGDHHFSSTFHLQIRFLENLRKPRENGCLFEKNDGDK